MIEFPNLPILSDSDGDGDGDGPGESHHVDGAAILEGVARLPGRAAPVFAGDLRRGELKTAHMRRCLTASQPQRVEETEQLAISTAWNSRVLRKGDWRHDIKTKKSYIYVFICITYMYYIYI